MWQCTSLCYCITHVNVLRADALAIERLAWAWAWACTHITVGYGTSASASVLQYILLQHSPMHVIVSVATATNIAWRGVLRAAQISESVSTTHVTCWQQTIVHQEHVNDRQHELKPLDSLPAAECGSISPALNLLAIPLLAAPADMCRHWPYNEHLCSSRCASMPSRVLTAVTPEMVC